MEQIFLSGVSVLNMERRALLKCVGGGIAGTSGCMSPLPAAGSFETRRVSVTEITPSKDYPVSLSVDVIEPMVTAEHSARIKVRFENTGSSESPELGHKTLGQIHSTHRNLAMLAVGIEGPGPTNICWTTDQFGGLGADFQPGITLAPGETWAKEYRLWDTTPETSCMPPGTYRFGDESSNVTPPFEWSFTLTLEKGTQT